MTLMTNLSGYVVYGNDAGGAGLVQQFGNFPRVGQNLDEPGNNFEASVRAGYTATGQFIFSNAQVSAGQEVVFDLVQGVRDVEAMNVRVP